MAAVVSVPSPVSGMAKTVFSVATRKRLPIDTPTPPPITKPSHTETCHTDDVHGKEPLRTVSLSTPSFISQPWINSRLPGTCALRRWRG